MAVGDIGIGDWTSRVCNRSQTYLLVALDVPFDGKGPTFWWQRTYLFIGKRYVLHCQRVRGSSMKGRSSAFAREGLMRTHNLICCILMFMVQSALEHLVMALVQFAFRSHSVRIFRF